MVDGENDEMEVEEEENKQEEDKEDKTLLDVKRDLPSSSIHTQGI